MPPAPLLAPPRQRTPGTGARTAAIVGIAAIVLAAAAAVMWSRSGGQTAQPPAAVSSQTAAPAATTPATPPPAPATPAPQPVPAAPAHAVNVELRTLQPVWMRVTVDGEKQFEKMIDAGQRLQFGGDRAVVIRVGNGGDVLVKSAAGEEPFGAAGRPLTRAFAPAPRGAAK